ncbi:hypothetical protein CKALI_04335 [Corynebacterium kalinowskii]|uniref:Uncharacterized protein n=1 Tax=Corynebacterium kalinowskii TaxID=2675216 RepID=A0A6B8VSP3_9CORY|nr:hypothetical protein [Corynebacterium kalinowskii]QGU01746.1 hypothetical protein CKALI_04335 [Corynebacterium kalinowskii]
MQRRILLAILAAVLLLALLPPIWEIADPCRPYQTDKLPPLKAAVLNSAPDSVHIELEDFNPGCGVQPILEVTASAESMTFEQVSQVLDWADNLQPDGFWGIQFRLNTTVDYKTVTINDTKASAWSDTGPYFALNITHISLHTRSRSAILTHPNLDTSDDVRALNSELENFSSPLRTTFVSDSWTIVFADRPGILGDLAAFIDSSPELGAGYKATLHMEDGTIRIDETGASISPEPLRERWPHGNVWVTLPSKH